MDFLTQDCFAALVATPDLSFSKVRRRQRVQNKEIHRNIREVSTLLYTVGMHHPGVKVVILTDELSAKFVSMLVPRPSELHHSKCITMITIIIIPNSTTTTTTTTTTNDNHTSNGFHNSVIDSSNNNTLLRPDVEAHIFVELDWIEDS